MPNIWATIYSVLITLTVTFIFNYFVGLPKKIRNDKEQDKKIVNNLILRIDSQEQNIKELQEVVDNLPKYREQSLQIQAELKEADVSVKELCETIKNEDVENRKEVMQKLDRLEEREKNALRAKILEEHRFYTDEQRNPLKAWSEMEEHSFRKLVEDYEALGGNDYVHEIVLPDMNRLDVISMQDLARLKELYDSRKIK